MNTQAMPPIATLTRKNNEIAFMAARSRSLVVRVDGFRGVERGREALLLAVVARAIPEFRSADAGRFMVADNVAVGILAGHLVEEDVLCDDDITFHANHLGDVSDAAGAIAQACRLYDDVHRSAHHFP